MRDPDADGRDDLVARNLSTGEVAVGLVGGGTLRYAGAVIHQSQAAVLVLEWNERGVSPGGC